MKKTILFLLALLTTVGVSAQTNFRDITFDEGVAAAKAEKKPLFVDFYTSWCGPCKMMAKNVFPQQAFGKFMNDHFVCLKIDAEKGEGPQLAKKYGVKAYPTFVVIDPATLNATNTFVGGRTADAFQGELERAMNPNRTFEKVEALYKAGDRKAQTVKDYAGYLTNQARTIRDRKAYAAKLDSINQLVQDYFAALPVKKRLSPENYFVYKQYMRSVDCESAKFLIDNLQMFPKAEQAGLDSNLVKMVNTEVYTYFNGEKAADKAGVDNIKTIIDKLGKDQFADVTPLFGFIDASATGDLSAYVDYCQQHFGDLSPMLQETLLYNYSGHFREATPEVKTKAAQFLRSVLHKLSAGGITFAGYQVGALEGTLGH